MKRLTNLALLSFVLLIGGMGCIHVAPGGAYDGDATLAKADQVLVTSYNTVHEFLQWELANRAVLVKYPGVTRAADAIRKNFETDWREAAKLREIYSLERSTPNRDRLETALVLVRGALTAAVNGLAAAKGN